MPGYPATVKRLREALLAAAAREGGWPYYSGKTSRIEPTCWALLALGDTWSDDADARGLLLAHHLRWLSTKTGHDGILLDAAGAPPNFTSNGVAACVVDYLRSPGPNPDVPNIVPRLLEALAVSKGISVDSVEGRQDNRLQGWSWMPDTFSWIEPTAWCLLALKKSGRNVRGAQARIEEADKLILNRTCESGGWTFGNASAVGQDLRAYVPTTALSLIALQDRRETPEVERSLEWLREGWLKEASAMALALTAICFKRFGVTGDDVEARLADDVERAVRLGNLQTLAMTLYALTLDRHEGQAFRV